MGRRCVTLRPIAGFLAASLVGLMLALPGRLGAADDAPPKAAAVASGPEPLDYATLSHTLSIDSLRAGTHDASGASDYYFSVALYGLVNTAEERNLAFEKRKQVRVELGKFGEIHLESLAIWRPDDKLKDFKEIKVDGNAVRELAAKTMTQLNITEADVSVMEEIAMTKRNKKFIFFGNDQVLAKVTYYPIPPTKFDAQLRTNQMLMISDDKGTAVRVAVRYDKPAGAPKK